jgi:hypothetical protein
MEALVELKTDQVVEIELALGRGRLLVEPRLYLQLLHVVLLVGSEECRGDVVHVTLFGHASVYAHEAVGGGIDLVRNLNLVVISQML